MWYQFLGAIDINAHGMQLETVKTLLIKGKFRQ